jgi:carboxyl-terminal processing protease
MVNNYSASASEILAGVIQDYNRGIILGSDHTFGKGTVQRFFELDQIAPEPFQMYKPFGSLKMSTQKFYRVDGTSTQLKGVRSDIILPSLYDLNEEREKDLDYAMPWDVTSAAKYKTLDMKEKNKYIANSQKRIKNNFYFNLTKEKVALIKQKTDKKDLPLAFADYKDYVDKTEQSMKKYDTLNNMKTKLKADFVNGNASKEKDSMRIELGKKFVTNVEKDFYIEEAVQVILDMKKS